MNFISKVISTCLLLTISLSAFSAEEKKGSKGWFGAAEFGLIITSGNTDTSTATGKFEVSYDVENWLHFAKFEAVNAEVDNTTTAERYLINLKSDYKMDEDQFLFGGLTHDIDKFSGFDSQSTLFAGYGRNLYNSKKFQLSAEIGPGYRTSELDDGSNDSEVIIHFGSKSKYTVNEYSHFAADLSIDGGSDQTITIFNIGYVNKLNNSLALKFSFNIKQSSDVPAGSDDTDTITAISLLYSF